MGSPSWGLVRKRIMSYLESRTGTPVLGNSHIGLDFRLLWLSNELPGHNIWQHHVEVYLKNKRTIAILNGGPLFLVLFIFSRPFVVGFRRLPGLWSSGPAGPSSSLGPLVHRSFGLLLL